MLITCPECNLQASDKAISCPHCGYPLKESSQPINIQPPAPKRRMRLPNGFGNITKINGNLRNPYRVMVPAGKTPEGRPISKLLKPQSYFKTYNDAYQALVEYHRNPYDPNTRITFKEIFKLWLHELEITGNRKKVSSARSLWRYSTPIEDIVVQDIRIHHLKDCLMNGTAIRYGQPIKISVISRVKLKFLYNQLFDYAVQNEYVPQNISRMFSIDSEIIVQHEHFPYTEEELNILWNNVGVCEAADLLLIQCYSGWRPQELCKLKVADVHLEERWIEGGIKTKSGKHRQVPIHKKILPLIKRRYEQAQELGSEYLFNHPYERWPDRWTHYTYDYYSNLFMETFPALGINPEHRGHDGRVHFVTAAKKYNLDEYAIKRIVGHAIKDLTERVYTKRSVDWLVQEIDKIV